MSPEAVQTAVVVAMLAAATAAFAWAMDRWLATQQVHYTALAVAFCTAWIATLVFASGYLWERGAIRAHRTDRPRRFRPPAPPGRAGGTSGPATLVDLPPVPTQEIPNLWYPPVSESARGGRNA